MTVSLTFISPEQIFFFHSFPFSPFQDNLPGHALSFRLAPFKQGPTANDALKGIDEIGLMTLNTCDYSFSMRIPL